MDAIPEDREIKALKHSNPLLQDINNRLPGLLWDVRDGEKRLRPRVKVADYNHIIGRVGPGFQFLHTRMCLISIYLLY